MFGGEGSMYWIEYKLFVCLGSYSRSHIIGIKVGWFGFLRSNLFGGNAILLKEKDPCTGSNINFLFVLVHIADPILLGLKLVGLV